MFGDQQVTMIDLSLKGVRFETSKTVPLGERIDLTIETHRGLIRVAATALWCQLDDLVQPDASERYLAGVMFDAASEEVGDLLERLLRADLAIPIEEHRNADRFFLTLPLPGTYATQSARLLDLSIRGARVSVPQFVPIGTTTALSFPVAEETLEVQATVMWCLGAVDDGFECGLKVEGAEDRLRIAINRLCLKEQAKIDLHSLRRRFNSMRALLHQHDSQIAS